MRRAVSVVVALGMLLACMLQIGLPSAHAADPIPSPLFYKGPSFGSTIDDDPTAAKPQSKLWYNGGFWWAVMFHIGDGKYHIYKLSWPGTWVDTNVVVDDRPLSRADVLSDGTTLYILSALSDENTSTAGPGRLYRYTYSAGTYALDSGFPVVVTGAVNPVVETMTFDKDTTGRLWITYTRGTTVYVNYSDVGGASWGEPFQLPGSGSVGTDDISSLVAYKDSSGSSIGVLWSSHTSSSAASAMYFAYHKDSDAPKTWQPVERIYGDSSGSTGSCIADDHINIKSLQADPSSGALFAALKTSIGDSGCPTSTKNAILLVVRNPNNSWKWTTFGTTTDDHTRPIVLLDSDNRRVYMFATSPTKCGTIYYKSTSMSNPDFSNQPGKGTPFISAGGACLNNATSTKQPLTNSTNLVVLASDETGKFYYHNVLDLGPATATATPTASATAAPGSTATPTAAPPGGTRIKDITFENSSLTDPTTGADAIIGTVARETSAPLKGVASARISTASSYLREDISSADELFVSFIIKLNALPPATARIALIANGSTSVGNIIITTNGVLQLRNNGTMIAGSSPALAVGTLYRVGLHQKKGSGANGVLEAYLAAGDSAFATPFAASAAQTFTSQATRFSLGATTSQAVNITVDDIQLDTAGFAPGGALSATATPTTPPATTSTPTTTPTTTPTPDPAMSPTPTSSPTSTPTSSPTTMPTPTATATPTPSGGVRIKDMTFEGGSLTGASGFDTAPAGVSLESASPIKGAYSARATTAYLTESFTGVDELYLSFYLNVKAFPSSSARIAVITNGSTSLGNLYLTSAGILQLRNGSTTIGSTSSAQAIARDTVYRIGIHQKQGSGNGVLEAYLVAGDTPFTAPFFTSAAQTIGAQANGFRLGATNSSALDIIVDDVRLDSAAMP